MVSFAQSSRHVLGQSVDNRLKVEPRRIEDNGIPRGFHGCDGSGAISGVSLSLIRQNLLKRRRLTLRKVLSVPPPRAFLLAGGQKELPECVGENDRPLISAFGHCILNRCELALPADQAAANAGTIRDETRGTGHLDASNLSSDVFSIQQDIAVGQQLDPDPFHEFFKGSIGAEIRLRANRREGNGAIHRSCVEQAPAESIGEQSSHGGLTGSGRTIDCDDVTHGQTAGTDRRGLPPSPNMLGSACFSVPVRLVRDSDEPERTSRRKEAACP